MIRLRSADVDLRSQHTLPVEDVVKAEVAFVIWVAKKTFTSWPRIGRVPVPPRPSPVFFKQDPISHRLFLYQDYRERPATFDECAGLECAAVWHENHVTDRLRDRFAGRPCRWVQSPKSPPA